MSMFSGKYIIPGWICGGLFLILLLWLSYELLAAYSFQHDCKKNIDRAVQTAIEKGMKLKSGSDRDREVKDSLILEFRKTAHRHLDALGRNTHFISYVFLMGCVAIMSIFMTWSYAIRNRELTKRLKQALSKKEQIDELGLAAAGLAHETKNPLGVIRGLAQNIANNTKNPQNTRRKAREIMEETDVTTVRLGDFLSYARFRSPVPEEINSSEYLERICSLVQDDFDNSGVELLSEVSPVTMIADPDMLSQVLMNLLTNSLKFTDKGGTVTLSCQQTGRKYATLKVIDTGRGIPPDVLPDMFKPYVTKGAGGYGIGLAIVKRIVDQAGWQINVKSTPGKGTAIAVSEIPVKTDI